jgi:hypothetical protein
MQSRSWANTAQAHTHGHAQAHAHAFALAQTELGTGDGGAYTQSSVGHQTDNSTSEQHNPLSAIAATKEEKDEEQDEGWCSLPTSHVLHYPPPVLGAVPLPFSCTTARFVMLRPNNKRLLARSIETQLLSVSSAIARRLNSGYEVGSLC